MMRRLFAATTAVLLLAAGCGDAGPSSTPAPGDPPFGDQLAQVEDHMFIFPMVNWQPSKHSSSYQAGLSWHNWTDDGCSKVPDSGATFDFSHSCHRHDFGYRNYKRLEATFNQDTWNSTNKGLVDGKFLQDMQAHCNGRPTSQRGTCNALARTYWIGVKLFG